MPNKRQRKKNVKKAQLAKVKLFGQGILFYAAQPRSQFMKYIKPENPFTFNPMPYQEEFLTAYGPVSKSAV